MTKPNIAETNPQVLDFVKLLATTFHGQAILQLDWPAPDTVILTPLNENGPSGDPQYYDHKGAPLRLPIEADAYDTVFSIASMEKLDDNKVTSGLAEMRRICRRTLWLAITVGPGRNRTWWEHRLFQAGFRKHPLHMFVMPYESLAVQEGDATLIFEKIPDSLLVNYPLAALAAEHDLHMDMTRESGPRSDAHIARYQLAAGYAREGDVIVDAACGLGYGSALLAAQCPKARVIGLDLSETAIAYARDNFAPHLPNLEFHVADVCSLEVLGDCRIDLLVSFETLEHMPDPGRFLGEASKRMAQEGRFIGSVPNLWVDETGKDSNPHHLHTFDFPKFRALAERFFGLTHLYRQNAERGVKGDHGRILKCITTEPEAADQASSEWWILAGQIGVPSRLPRDPARNVIPASAFSTAELDVRLDEFLTVCGEGRALVTGFGATAIARKLLMRGVDAWSVDAAPDAITLGLGERFRSGTVAQIPAGHGPFHSAIILGGLDVLSDIGVEKVIHSLQSVITGSLLVRVCTVPGRNRAWWENLFFKAGFRKHPIRHHVQPYAMLEQEQPVIVMYFERLSQSGEAFDAVSGSIALPADPGRQSGREADATLAGYELAAPLVRPWDIVLDLDCGSGTGTHLLQRATRGAKFIGVTPEAIAANYAQAHFSASTVEFRHAALIDAVKEMPEASIDFAVWTPTQPETAICDSLLETVKGVLTPGGRLVLMLRQHFTPAQGAALRSRLEQDFLIEAAFRQEGRDEPLSLRACQKINCRELGAGEAHAWIVVAMKDPLDEPIPPYRETAFRNAVEGPHAAVLRYPEFYQNPWILHSLVHGGFRLSETAPLVRTAHRLLDTVPEDSADAGAALCVLMYRTLEDPTSADLNRADLVSRVERYLASETTNAHQARWQISINYVLALLAMVDGDMAQARRRFVEVADRDVFQWGPSLATKTTEALFMAGWLAWCAGELEACRGYWTRGVEFGRQLLAHPLDETLMNPACPNLFDYGDGMRELTYAVENVGRCANGLHGLYLREKGISCRWEHIFNSFRNQLENTRHALREAYARLSCASSTPPVPAPPPVQAAQQKMPQLDYDDGVHKDEGGFRWLDSVAMLKVIVPENTPGALLSFKLRAGNMEWYRSSPVRTIVLARDQVVREIQFSEDFQTESVEIELPPGVEPLLIRLESEPYFGGGSDDPRHLTVQLRQCSVKPLSTPVTSIGPVQAPACVAPVPGDADPAFLRYRDLLGVPTPHVDSDETLRGIRVTSGPSPAAAAAASAVAPAPEPAVAVSISLEAQAECEYRQVEIPRYFDREQARRALDIFSQWPETVEYHRNHLNRYLATMERVRHLPRSTRVLEVGATPFGMTVLMKDLLFDVVQPTGFAENDSKRAQDVYSERLVLGKPEEGRGYEFILQCFNIEKHKWPFPDASFDLVISCEVFEHLALDPMHAMAESNRVLRPGGTLLISVPNVLSVSNLHKMIEGRSPNSFPVYRPRGECLRHNRELTPTELATLFESAGFVVDNLETSTFSEPPRVPPQMLARLHALTGGFKWRHEVLTAVGHKQGPVVCRHPLQADLYYEWDVKANRV